VPNLPNLDYPWLAVNIIAPCILPMFGLLLIRSPLTDDQKKKARFITTVQDGQLGWVAVLWSIAAVYEAVDFMSTTGRWVNWAGWLLAAEAIILLCGMSIAAGGCGHEHGRGKDGSGLPLVVYNGVILLRRALRRRTHEAQTMLTHAQRAPRELTPNQVRNRIGMVAGLTSLVAGILGLVAVIFL
jgi:hypothetical protein